jgi:hypothetical protein
MHLMPYIMLKLTVLAFDYASDAPPNHKTLWITLIAQMGSSFSTLASVGSLLN